MPVAIRSGLETASQPPSKNKFVGWTLVRPGGLKSTLRQNRGVISGQALSNYEVAANGLQAGHGPADDTIANGGLWAASRISFVVNWVQ